MIRYEYKWSLDRMRSEQLKRAFSLVMQRDKHVNDEGFYWVSSLYFDDCYDSRLFEKQDGEPKRPKIRMRRYSDVCDKNDYDVPLYCESKLKQGDIVVKNRILLSEGEAKTFIDSPWKLNQVFPDAHAEALFPVQLIRYKRYSYVIEGMEVRVTFDEDIMGSVNRRPSFYKENRFASVVDDQTVIMEVKYSGSLPDAIRAVLSDAGVKSAWSKYAYSRQLI